MREREREKKGEMKKRIQEEIDEKLIIIKITLTMLILIDNNLIINYNNSK